MVPILKTIKKVPGGLMVVPLFLGCIINTFFPAALKIGSFTTALTQANPMMAIFFVCTAPACPLRKLRALLKQALSSRSSSSRQVSQSVLP